MKNFVSFRSTALVFFAALITQVTSADASVSFVGVAAGDESSPGPTQLNVQITTDPNFITGVTTLLAGTADATTDYTVKTNIGNLHSASVYYYQ